MTFDGSQFQKQDRILWLRWQFEEIENGLVARLSPVVMYQYYNENNVYFWIDEGLPDKPAYHHVITAPDDKDSKDTLGQIPQRIEPADTICLVRLLSKGRVTNAVFCDHVKSGNEPATFIDHTDGRIGLGLRHNFFERFFDAVSLSMQVRTIELWGTTLPWPSNDDVQRF